METCATCNLAITENVTQCELPKRTTLFSTNCPKCKVLETKLKQAGLDFDIITDTGAVVNIGKAYNILSAPILYVGGRVLDFTGALAYLKGEK